MTSSPFNALFVWYAPFRVGGVETFLRCFSRLAACSGFPISVASTQDHEDGSAVDEYGVGTQFLDWSGFESVFMGERTQRKSMAERLIDDLFKVQPTVLFLNDCRSFGFGCLPLLKHIRPYCHIVDIMHTFPPPERRDYIDDRKVYASQLDGAVAVNKIAFQTFRETFPWLDTKTAYIVYGIEGEMVARQDRIPSELRIIYVGRLVQHQKRVRDLPVILRQLHEIGRPFRATIVGDGEEKNQLVGTIEEMGLSSLVRFTGQVSQPKVRELLAEHDISLNVSDFEGTPLTVLESLRAGCIPLSSKLPYTEDILQDGENGFICPVGACHNFARVLGEIQPAQLLRMRKNALDSGASFSVQAMFDRYMAFTKRVMSDRILRPWPDVQSPQWSHLRRGWDFSSGNPWLPHPHLFRRILQCVVPSLRRTR